MPLRPRRVCLGSTRLACRARERGDVRLQRSRHARAGAPARRPEPRALCAALVSYASPASAIDCGSHLVTTGDSETDVRSVCGAPTQVVSPSWPGIGGGRRVRITVWVYDFGPGRFVEELTFENGVLQSTRTLGPGTSRCAPPQG